MDTIKKDYVRLVRQNKYKSFVILVLLITLLYSACLNFYLLYTTNRLVDKTDTQISAVSDIVSGVDVASIDESHKSNNMYVEKYEPKDILVVAGNKYNIDPKLLEAIERLESGHYTSNLYKAKNNTWGAWGGNDWMSFNSREESTMALAKCLRENYYDKGLVELEDIGAKYCPDKTNTTDKNEAMEWAYNVRAIYNEL